MSNEAFQGTFILQSHPDEYDICLNVLKLQLTLKMER